ncbi:hypothetical protein TCAL_00740 [Tigriopus californicus]|uniref:Protein amnionless n=1 Tax=Tigriopus californicus TaxID=6832 RepID=A0A553PCB6_TIGCA|nr:hypothetical protein TCAL_00740 [Tigriopus californicus]|eukprot:TCALIF_00740-PA protein Name:"Similar to AMN Protein amnionless (Canis familiaris)" AED:0.22 eAED:0.23 QI:0/-1/0/1/-1/1/1/0/758
MWLKTEALLCFLFTYSSLQAEFKIWRQSLDLGNPKLWVDNQLPCPGQRMILPEKRVVFFPASLTIGAEMVLPNNGMVLFPKDFRGGFFTNKSKETPQEILSKCSNAIGDAVFLPKEASFWHDPANWRENEDPTPVPHLNQIPCRFDHVIFPSDAAYLVSISHHETHIGRLTIDQVGYDTTTFKAMATNPPGSMMFRGNQSLLVHQDHCTDALGCECGNTPILSTVCQLGGAQCHPPQCSSALKSFGHCCFDMCGSIIHIDTQTQDLKISLLEAVVKKHVISNSMDDEHGSNVKYHINRINAHDYEIMFVDSQGDIQSAIDIGRWVYQELQTLISPKGMYLWLEESDVTPPSALKRAGKAFGYLIVIGLTVALAYLALFVFNQAKTQKITPLTYGSWPSLTTSATSAFSFYKFRRTEGGNAGGQFSFGRLSEGQEMQSNLDEEFHSDDGSPSISMSEPSSLGLTFKSLKEAEDAEEADESLVRSFTNPMFEKVSKSALVHQPKNESESSNLGESEKSFSNPLFDENQEEANLGKNSVEPLTSTVSRDESNLNNDDPNFEVTSVPDVTKQFVQDDSVEYENTNINMDASQPEPVTTKAKSEVGPTVQGFENPNYQEKSNRETPSEENNPAPLALPKIATTNSATSFDNPNYQETPEPFDKEESDPQPKEDLGLLVDLELHHDESDPEIEEDVLTQPGRIEPEEMDFSPDHEKVQGGAQTTIPSPTPSPPFPTITITQDEPETVESKPPTKDEDNSSLMDI